MNIQLKKIFLGQKGKIKVIDSKNNTYNFSQVFIDEKNKEILGTDIKSFLNDDSFKINPQNKPRVFANTVKIKINKLNLQKAYSLYVIIEKRINAPHGLYRLNK